ncbi:MAG: GGDEF domain-containing protein [Deltaproteobacteria bacterium]|nr:GGDEF domain-containing protein [Deltaproteobacteria bacterium]
MSDGDGQDDQADDRKQSAARALLDVSGQPMLLMRESDTTVVAANRLAGELFDSSADELQGVDVKSLFADEESFVAFASKLYAEGAVEQRPVSLTTVAGDREPSKVQISARLGRLAEESVAAIVIEVPDNHSPIDAIAREQLDRDRTTGLYSRAYFLRIARHELERALRYERTLTLALLEIDGFKKVLKDRGKDTADELLAEVAERCRGCVRDLDLIARFRDDGFVALLPETGLKGAKQVFERMRGVIAGEPFGNGKVELSLSIGYSELLPTDDATADLLQRADKALYRAVESGRNAVKVA